jgi:hypothetical protein
MARSSRVGVLRGRFTAFYLSVSSLLAGCATQPSAVEFLAGTQTSVAVACEKPADAPAVEPSLSPAPEHVAPGDAWWMAEELVKSRSDCEALVGSGESMLPLYRDRTVLVVQRMPLSQLRRGMTVVFLGEAGRMVAHTLIAPTAHGWVAQGVGNAEPDRVRVRQRNYLGTVIRAFAPDASVPSVRVKVLPVTASGPSVGMSRAPRNSFEVGLALAPDSGR